MTFKFTPEPEDFHKAIRAFYLSNSWLWVIFAVVGLPQMWCGLSYLVRLDFTQIFNIILALFVILMIPALAVYLIWAVPARIAGQVRQSERMRSLHTWEVSDQQIIIKTDYSELKFKWDDFHRALEIRDHFLLIYAANRGLIEVVPKRAFDSPENLTAFRNQLMDKIPRFKTFGLSGNHR